MAKLLENAARDADINIIEALNNIFLNEWRSYKEKLKECVQIEQTENKQDIDDYTVILAYLEMLRLALEELDVDEMDRIMELLEGYEYLPEIQECIGQLGVYVINMDSEHATVLIEKISELMKNK